MFTKDPLFWKAMGNTVYIIVVGLPLRDPRRRSPRRPCWCGDVAGSRLYRTALFIPTLAPAVAGALAFLYLFNPATGPGEPAALGGSASTTRRCGSTTRQWAKPTLVILAIWGVGDAMIIFLAGMLERAERALRGGRHRGRERRQRFVHVTLPQISPVIFFSLVIGIIAGFQYFTQAYVVSLWQTGDAAQIGHPQNSLLFFTSRLYQMGFQNFKMGYASALAWVLLLITMVCTLIVIRNSKRWVLPTGGVPIAAIDAPPRDSSAARCPLVPRASAARRPPQALPADGREPRRARSRSRRCSCSRSSSSCSPR